MNYYIAYYNSDGLQIDYGGKTLQQTKYSAKKIADLTNLEVKILKLHSTILPPKDNKRIYPRAQSPWKKEKNFR